MKKVMMTLVAALMTVAASSGLRRWFTWYW